MKSDPSALYAIRQFEIEVWLPLRVFGVDVSFTNVSSAMMVTAILVACVMILASRRGQIIPGRVQAGVELLYEFVEKTVTKTAGDAAKEHVPFVFTLFVFIFFGTLIGLSPMKETFVTHLVVTGSLALFVFAYVVREGVRHSGSAFFRQFLPAGTPAWLAPLIVLVEVISYLARPITLATRLFANMFAGHMLIKLFGDFAVMMIDRLGFIGVVAAIGPVLLMVIFFAFETLVVLIQSYIFILLTSVYLRSPTETH